VRVVTLICGSVLVVYGLAGTRLQAGQAKPKPPAAPKPPKPAAKQAAKPAPKPAAKPVPADQLEKMLNMSPEDREKILSKLPPPQRQNVETRLNNLDKLPPQQRAQRLAQLRQLESGLEKLSPARRQAVNQEMQSIRKLPPGAARRAVIDSPEFQKSFSPEEQQLIRGQFPAASK
jgi:hypothetical protein